MKVEETEFSEDDKLLLILENKEKVEITPGFTFWIGGDTIKVKNIGFLYNDFRVTILKHYSEVNKGIIFHYTLKEFIRCYEERQEDC